MGIWENTTVKNNLDIEVNVVKPKKKLTVENIKEFCFDHYSEVFTTESLLKNFGDNIFDKVDNTDDYITNSFIKNYQINNFSKVLEFYKACFPLIGPNKGDSQYGRNYLMEYMIKYCLYDYDFSGNNEKYSKLYNLGIEYGMDPNYSDITNTNIYMYWLLSLKNSLNIHKVLEADLLKKGEILLDSENEYGVSIIDIIDFKLNRLTSLDKKVCSTYNKMFNDCVKDESISSKVNQISYFDYEKRNDYIDKVGKVLIKEFNYSREIV